MIHLYYGDGKGTTTAAIGISVRAAGAGTRVIFSQFLKGSYTSELEILKNVPNLDIVRSDEPIPFFGQMTVEDKIRIRKVHDRILGRVVELAEQELSKVEASSQNSGPDNAEHHTTCKLLIVLDEITYPLNWGLADAALVDRILELSNEQVEIVMTGRDPSEYLQERGDYVTEMKCHKHPYDKGLQARLGIEY